MSIQVIPKILKNEKSITVTFPTPFKQTPVVIVSGIYHEGLGHQEGVSKITKSECRITSGNIAGNYWVNVLAIQPGLSSFGKLQMIAGKKLKTETEVTVNLQRERNSTNPVTMLTPLWLHSNQGVGNIDTLDDSFASGFTVYSGNKASENYYTQYLDSNIGIGHDSNNNIMQTGIANKTRSGPLRVYFTEPFSSSPTVFLSPWWNEANAEVENVDAVAVNEVTKDYFVLTSNNQASNYYTNWIAYGS